jgi:hypothetical protein
MSRNKFVRPHLEELEPRILLTTYIFLPNGNGDPQSWRNGNNWVDEDTGRYGNFPNFDDDAVVPGGNVVKVDTGYEVRAAVLTLQAGSNLIVPATSLLRLDYGTLEGRVTDQGEIYADDAEGEVDFSGSTVIGPNPGFDTNLDGPGKFVFLPPASGTEQFAAGATIGWPGDANGPTVDIGTPTQAGQVRLAGLLGVYAGQVVLNGILSDPQDTNGSLDNFAGFTWQSGRLALTNGFTNESGASFLAEPSPNNPVTALTLQTNLANQSSMQFIGPYDLEIDNGGLLANVNGGAVTMVGITAQDNLGTGHGIFNAASAYMDCVPNSAGVGCIITCPFTSQGIIEADYDPEGSPTLVLNGPNMELDGYLNLAGTVDIKGTVTSYLGFTNQGGLGGQLVIESFLNLRDSGITNYGAIDVIGEGVIQGFGGDTLDEFTNLGVLGLLGDGQVRTLNFFTQRTVGMLFVDVHNGNQGADGIYQVANVLLDGDCFFINGPAPSPGNRVFQVVGGAGTINGEFYGLPYNTVETNTDTNVYITALGTASVTGTSGSGALARGAAPPGGLYVSTGSLTL